MLKSSVELFSFMLDNISICLYENPQTPHVYDCRIFQRVIPSQAQLCLSLEAPGKIPTRFWKHYFTTLNILEIVFWKWWKGQVPNNPDGQCWIWDRYLGILINLKQSWIILNDLGILVNLSKSWKSISWKLRNLE